MTVYIASNYFGAPNVTTSSMVIKNNDPTYDLRMIKIEGFTSSGAPSPFSIQRYAGAGVTGGTAITPQPLRDGAPATTATAKINATMSGTSSDILKQPYNGNAAFTYQFAADLLVAPGNALYCLSTIPGGGSLNLFFLDIYYEQLRLQRSS